MWSEHVKYLVGPLLITATLGAPLAYRHPGYLLITLAYYLVVNQIGFEIGFHRYMVHRSFTTSRWIEKVLLFLGTLSMTARPLYFAVQHRTHHNNSDTDIDPHSPDHGKLRTFLNFFRKEHNQKLHLLLGRDVLKNRFIMWLNAHYYGVFYGVFAICLVGWWPLALFGCVYGTLIGIFSYVFIASCVAHRQTNENKGYVNFNTNDNSINRKWNLLFFWFSWGGLLHNNHHGRPAYYSESTRPSEIDVAAYFINMIRSDRGRRSQCSTLSDSRETSQCGKQ